MLLAVVSVVVPVFADIDMALHWRAVRIVGGDVKGGPISTEVHAGNIDVNRPVTETDLETPLLGLPRAGIGDIRCVIKVSEAPVRLLREFLVHLRKVKRERRSSRMVKLSRLAIGFVNYPFVLCGVPVALLFANQFHRAVGQLFAKKVLGGYLNRCVLTRQIVGAIRLGRDGKAGKIVATD